MVSEEILDRAFQRGESSVSYTAESTTHRSGNQYTTYFKEGYQMSALKRKRRIRKTRMENRIDVIEEKFDDRIETGFGGFAFNVVGIDENRVIDAVAECEDVLVGHLYDLDFKSNDSDASALEKAASEAGVTLKVTQHNPLVASVKGLRNSVKLFQLMMTTNSSSEVRFPDHWDVQDGNVLMVKIAAHSIEYQRIANAFRETMPNAAIAGIERVQNLHLWRKYAREKQAMSNDREVHLFHGTQGTDPKVIYEGNGIDFRYSSSSNMWGAGAYFAAKASYSHAYSYQHTEKSFLGLFPSNYRKMFLASVLVGDEVELKSTSNTRKFREAPKKPDGFTSYDSVKGFTNGSTVYVVYDQWRSYPSYLITYN